MKVAGAGVPHAAEIKEQARKERWGPSWILKEVCTSFIVVGYSRHDLRWFWRKEVIYCETSISM